MKSSQQPSLGMDMSGVKYTPPSNKLIMETLAHYRRTGFPYIELSEHEKVSELSELQNFPAHTLIQGQDVYADSTGVALANMYHKHRYGVVCGENRTALYVFTRDHLLEKAIAKCFKLQGGISDSKLRSMLSIFEGVQVASNFPPATAKAIYEHFLPNSGLTWDMSCGWGGRLLAAFSTKAVTVYYGTEPSTLTYNKLLEMAVDISNLPMKIDTMLYGILMQGSEVELPSDMKSVDLCFTSPPYFAAEKYAREDTQSFLKYPYPSDWMKYFIGGTLKNCKQILKPNGRVVVNIANVKSYPDLENQFIKRADAEGFKIEEIKFLLYTAMPGSGNKNRQEGE